MKILGLKGTELCNNGTIWAVADSIILGDEVFQDHVHGIPRDAVHWRIAEYDLNDTDQDIALRLLLHEVHLEPEDDINCWTEGYSISIILQQRLAAIDKNEAKAGAKVPKTLKIANAITVPAHKHALLNPVREVDGKKIDIRRSIVQARRDVRKGIISGKKADRQMREAVVRIQREIW